MKASKAEAKKAQASLSQAESLADVNRKISLIMAHLKVADTPDDPEADAAVDEAAAMAAGTPPADSRPPTEAEEVEAETKAAAEGRTHRRRR